MVRGDWAAERIEQHGATACARGETLANAALMALLQRAGELAHYRRQQPVV